MPPTSRHNLIARPLAVLLSLTAVLAACGGGKDEVEPTTTSEATTTAPTTAPIIAPLTGLPTDGATAGRPALIVKIDNVEPKARPQAGINQADVVYEERVEGSVTRLLAIFHSSDIAPVGPVRSARTSDIGIFSALNRPYFAWSGANQTFAQRIRSANVNDVGYDRASDFYKRERSRPAPSNLMLKSTADIRALPSEGSSAPPPLFSYRAADEAPAGLVPTAGVRVSYGTSAGAAPVEYRWNGSGWARSQKGSPHVDSAGLQVAPENVVIQFVPYAGSDVVDQFGTPIPEAQLLGEGDVWVLTAGGLISGRWHKASLETVTTYTDASGNPIKLTPGHTWVALPTNGGAERL